LELYVFFNNFLFQQKGNAAKFQLMVQQVELTRQCGNISSCVSYRKHFSCHFSESICL